MEAPAADLLESWVKNFAGKNNLVVHIGAVQSLSDNIVRNAMPATCAPISRIRIGGVVRTMVADLVT